MLNHLKLVGLFLCISVPLMFFAFNRSAQNMHAVSRGNYFFEKTRQNSDVKSVVLKFSDGQILTFVQKGNFWHIKETDDYYASFVKMNTFFKLIRDAMIYRADLLNKEELEKYKDSGLYIQTKDSNGKIIDDAFIVTKQDNNKLHYAMLNHDNFLYQITQDFELSPYPMDWVQMPLLTIAYNQIKFLKTDNFQVYRSYNAEPLKSVETDIEVPQIHNLVNNLWYLSASDIKHAVHFNRDKYKLVKTFEINTIDGLIYTIDVFNGNDEFWFNIKLGHSQLITAQSVKRLKENSMLYDGWFFKIKNDLAEDIVRFII